MADFSVGDIVVLTSGSMRMAVESVEEGVVHTVWCNEGIIGRDTFPVVLLRKWEDRPQESRSGGGGDRGGFNKGGDRGGYKGGGDRGGFNKGGDRDERGGGNDRGAPPRPMGRDGKPKDRKFFRKD